jgi:hypothetical protein
MTPRDARPNGVTQRHRTQAFGSRRRSDKLQRLAGLV